MPPAQEPCSAACGYHHWVERSPPPLVRTSLPQLPLPLAPHGVVPGAPQPALLQPARPAVRLQDGQGQAAPPPAAGGVGGACLGQQRGGRACCGMALLAGAALPCASAVPSCARCALRCVPPRRPCLVRSLCRRWCTPLTPPRRWPPGWSRAGCRRMQTQKLWWWCVSAGLGCGCASCLIEPFGVKHAGQESVVVVSWAGAGLRCRLACILPPAARCLPPAARRSLPAAARHAALPCPAHTLHAPPLPPPTPGSCKATCTRRARTACGSARTVWAGAASSECCRPCVRVCASTASLAGWHCCPARALAAVTYASRHTGPSLKGCMAHPLPSPSSALPSRPTCHTAATCATGLRLRHACGAPLSPGAPPLLPRLWHGQPGRCSCCTHARRGTPACTACHPGFVPA